MLEEKNKRVTRAPLSSEARLQPRYKSSPQRTEIANQIHRAFRARESPSLAELEALRSGRANWVPLFYLKPQLAPIIS